MAVEVKIIGSKFSGTSNNRVYCKIVAGSESWAPGGAYGTAANNINDIESPFVSLPAVSHTFMNVAAGTPITIKGYRHGGSEVRSSDTDSSGSKVRVFRTGDVVPSIPGYGGQGTAVSYLGGLIDAETNTVTIDPNQAIYLIELYTSNVSSQYYDLQDIVALVTFAPAIEATPSM